MHLFLIPCLKCLMEYNLKKICFWILSWTMMRHVKHLKRTISSEALSTRWIRIRFGSVMNERQNHIRMQVSKKWIWKICFLHWRTPFRIVTCRENTCRRVVLPIILLMSHTKIMEFEDQVVRVSKFFVCHFMWFNMVGLYMFKAFACEATAYSISLPSLKDPSQTPQKSECFTVVGANLYVFPTSVPCG
jgi:hypothetical protein